MRRAAIKTKTRNILSAFNWIAWAVIIHIIDWKNTYRSSKFKIRLLGWYHHCNNTFVHYTALVRTITATYSSECKNYLKMFWINVSAPTAISKASSINSMYYIKENPKQWVMKRSSNIIEVNWKCSANFNIEVGANNLKLTYIDANHSHSTNILFVSWFVLSCRIKISP